MAGRGLEELTEFETTELKAKLVAYSRKIEAKLRYGQEHFMQEHRTQMQNWGRQLELIGELLDAIDEGDIE